MIKVLPGSRGLIKRLQSIGGKNINNYSGIGIYYNYYIDPITKHIRCILKGDTSNKEFIICKTFEEYQRIKINEEYQEVKQLINYQEI